MKRFFTTPWGMALIPIVLMLITAGVGGFGYQPFPDSGDYLVLGENFFSGFEQNTNVPAGWRTMGYPFLLAIFYKILGVYSYLAVNILALYFSTFILLIWCKRWRISSWLMLFFISTSAGWLALGASALSEIPFVFFLLLNLELLQRRAFLPAAIVLSIATMIRPAAMFLWVIELVVLYILYRPKWRTMVAFVVLANSLVMLWAVRNYAIYDHLAFTSHSGRYLLYYKVGSAVSANSDDLTFEDFRFACAEKLTGDEFEQDKQAKAIAVEWIKDNPLKFAVATIKDLPRFFMPDFNAWLERTQLTVGNRGTLDVLRREGVIVAINHYFNDSNRALIIAVTLYTTLYGITLLLALYGAWQLYHTRNYRFLIIALLLISYFWLLPAGNLDYRFRVPIWWLFMLLATYGVSSRFCNVQKSDADAQNQVGE